ncbi:MAG TPA: hypothetical protein VFK94_06465 [Patescibacteria group bacterium]|nr:hypothetical protein [Patescibacteria group bacterium]
MSEPDIGSFFKTLGVAAPLVALLWFLLKQATEERKEITDKFLTALQTTVRQSTESQTATMTQITKLNSTVEEYRRISAEEHARIVDAIGKMTHRS